MRSRALPLGKSQPTISHHTRVLARAGLIEGDKRDKWPSKPPTAPAAPWDPP